jgi:hypothetical protein
MTPVYEFSVYDRKDLVYHYARPEVASGASEAAVEASKKGTQIPAGQTLFNPSPEVPA